MASGRYDRLPINRRALEVGMQQEPAGAVCFCQSLQKRVVSRFWTSLLLPPLLRLLTDHVGIHRLGDRDLTDQVLHNLPASANSGGTRHPAPNQHSVESRSRMNGGRE